MIFNINSGKVFDLYYLKNLNQFTDSTDSMQEILSPDSS